MTPTRTPRFGYIRTDGKQQKVNIQGCSPGSKRMKQAACMRTAIRLCQGQAKALRLKSSAFHNSLGETLRILANFREVTPNPWYELPVASVFQAQTKTSFTHDRTTTDHRTLPSRLTPLPAPCPNKEGPRAQLRHDKTYRLRKTPSNLFGWVDPKLLGSR